MIKVASLQYGVIFKKAFSQPRVFKAFVEDILGIEVEIDTIETEKSFSPIIGNVDTRFDLYAVDKKNRLIIDIQHKRHSDHYDRFLHYHMVALIEQVRSYGNYKPDMNVYTIVVLTSGDKHKKDVLVNDFRPQDLDGNYVEETAHKLMYLCPKYVNNKTKEPYKKWLELIDDSLDGEMEEDNYINNEIADDIIGAIRDDKIDPKIAFKMKEEYSEVEYVKDIKAKGKEEGIKEGAKQKQIEIAKNLLKANIDIDTIALSTGLSIQEIENLKKETKQCH